MEIAPHPWLLRARGRPHAERASVASRGGSSLPLLGAASLLFGELPLRPSDPSVELAGASCLAQGGP
jgi:hypothetical protein